MKITITVDVEEWFHTNWFNYNEIRKNLNDKETPKTDVVEKTQELIDLFDLHDVRGTFFVLGETISKYPELMDLWSDNYHEFACHGFYHNKLYNDKGEFKRDILKFKNEIKPNINGFRFPNFSYTNEKLEVLVEEGFKYDSSVVPCLNIPGWYGESNCPLTPHKKNLTSGYSINELPLSVLPYFRLPGCGGWFLRNVGYYWTNFLIKSNIHKSGYAVLYIHPWEISDNNPKFNNVPFHVFRNTGLKTLNNIKKLLISLSEYDFITLYEQSKIWRIL